MPNNVSISYISDKSGKELRHVEGDVSLPKKMYSDEIIVIPHCCNNLRTMNAGVALSLKNKWISVFDIYKKSNNELGTVSYAQVEKDIVVANMIGQDNLISKNNPKPIKYYALMQAMIDVKDKCLHHIKQGKRVTIHAPEFGGLRAGGNFDFIEEIIKEIWVDNGIDVVIYKFKEK